MPALRGYRIRAALGVFVTLRIRARLRSATPYQQRESGHCRRSQSSPETDLPPPEPHWSALAASAVEIDQPAATTPDAYRRSQISCYGRSRPLADFVACWFVVTGAGARGRQKVDSL
jgi:hypothetical protein